MIDHAHDVGPQKPSEPRRDAQPDESWVDEARDWIIALGLLGCVLFAFADAIIFLGVTPPGPPHPAHRAESIVKQLGLPDDAKNVYGLGDGWWSWEKGGRRFVGQRSAEIGRRGRFSVVLDRGEVSRQ